MRRGTAPTLQDVAREAGVTAMTVSVVLNGARSATRVSTATRARIEEAAARLRYRPNAVARGLSRRRMDSIGVAASVGTEVNLYFLEVLTGILSAGAAHGQNITVFSIGNWQQEEQRISEIFDGRVDGLILIAPSLSESLAESLRQRAPFVTIHRAGRDAGDNNFDIDNEAAAMRITRHLIDLGHRRIAHITGLLSASGARERLAGYQRALTEAGLPVEEDLIIPGNFMVSNGRHSMARLLDLPGPRPTAVFCANDALACGAMETLSARGLAVPGDISVAGLDDLLLSRMTNPHLTTIHQPFREMGGQAVEYLLAQIAHDLDPDTPAPLPLNAFEAPLIVRGSTGPPPDGG